MKNVKITVLCFLITILGLTKLSAQTDFAPAIGVALKASTEGLGGDAVYNFNKKMSIRLGYESLALNHDFSFTEESITYDAIMNYKTGSLSLLFDYYLSKSIFVTAGAGYNLFDAALNGKSSSGYQYGDILISNDKIGIFDITVKPSMKVSPYLGIGFGRTLGLAKKLGFAFELGGFYQGSPDINIVSTGLLLPSSDPDQQHSVRLEKQVSQYTIYPVLKFSLSYKIVNL